METVEVLVRIPKDMYERTLLTGVVVVGIDAAYIGGAIINGTVLSKGHWIQQPRYEGDDQPDLVCPNCGFKISWWDMGNFCAKCGKGLEGGAG